MSIICPDTQERCTHGCTESCWIRHKRAETNWVCGLPKGCNTRCPVCKRPMRVVGYYGPPHEGTVVCSVCSPKEDEQVPYGLGWAGRLLDFIDGLRWPWQR